MNKLRLSTFVKVDKTNYLEQVPVFVKISIFNTNTSMSLDHWVDNERWKITKQFKVSRALKEIIIKRDIDHKLNLVTDIFNKLELKGLPFSANEIKDIYLKGDASTFNSNIMLSELFTKNELIYKPLVDTKDRAKETLRKYKTIQKHVNDFLLFEYGLEDISLNKLNYGFIDAFDGFLRSVKKIGNNTTVKYVQTFGSLMRLAVKYEWLLKNPFVLYNKKIVVKDADFLTKEELSIVENLTLDSNRLEVVRDIFIFGCYTGYAPIDIMKLTYDNIQRGNDGQKWIMANRWKTKIQANVPLLKKAENITDKYRDDFNCIKSGLLLPKRSNQKINQYLKEIAILTGINKKFTQYLSRHTFSCTVVLANGLSMEVLSKMLGHTNLKQTMHYGKIQSTRVGQEMKILREKLNE